MKQPALLLLLFLWLTGPALAQPAEPAAPAATAPAQIKKIKFSSTKAQATAPRVKAARQRRLGDIRKLFAEAGIDYPPAQVLLRGFKNEDLLELWARPSGSKAYVHLKSYAICMRSGDLGPKRQRGDMQVPEGFYSITAYNPNSSFLLAMLVSYPNRSDRIRKAGRDVGGNICIHGDCVTIGCIPLTDRWIEELYLICLDTARLRKNPTLVHLFPGRLAGEDWQKLKTEAAARPELIRFWEEIKPGYERFEETQIPARFSIDTKGAYRFR